MKIKRFSDTGTGTGTGESVGSALGASGLAAGIGAAGSKIAENAEKSSENIADKVRWTRSTGKKGELVLDEKNPKLAEKLEKAGKSISKFAKKKHGKACMIAVPALLAGGTTYVVKKKRRKKND